LLDQDKDKDVENYLHHLLLLCYVCADRENTSMWRFYRWWSNKKLL